MTKPMFARVPRSVAVAAAGALALVALAPAQAEEPKVGVVSAPVTEATPAAKKERQYCVKAETTGTRMLRKICKTRAEWIAQENFDPAQK